MTLPTLYVVEIRRERGDLAKIMSGIREWLDSQRFEPDAFRCETGEESVTFRLEFGKEGEAFACAEIPLEPLGQIVFPEFDADPKGVAVFSRDVEIRRDAVIVIEPFAQLAQRVGQFPPSQTQLYLAHYQPAVHYRAPGFPNWRTARRSANADLRRCRARTADHPTAA